VKKDINAILLEIILDNINQAIIAIDNNNTIVSCNKTAEDYFCFEYSQPVQIESVITNTNIIDNIFRAVTKNEFISYDHMRLNGQVFEVRFFPVNLREISLIITAQNVTDVRKITREKQEFFVNASHELNTPLSSILGYAEILKREKKYNPEFVDTIYRQAERMKNLIGDMLVLSELEEGKELPDEIIDLSQIANEVLSAYKPKAENKNIALTAELESLKIRANKEKITTIISNLIDNSIKYTEKGGNVLLAIKMQDGKKVISVKDNGIGIAQKHLSRICERFFRTDRGRSRAEGGTGLGLAIVKHVCNHYGATLTISSKEGAGTEVVVKFMN